MNCNYKVKITDIQTKYKFKVFCTGYDDSEIKEKIDTMYEAWPKASGEGETPTLDNTANATMSIDLKGNTSQETTIGKNLIPNDFRQGNTTSTTATNRIFTTNGAYLKANQSYIISTNLNVSNFYWAIRVASTQFPATADVFTGDWNTSGTQTYTPTQNCYLGVIIGKRDLNASISVSDIGNTYVQVEEGNTATAYEEYTGGVASPNPDYPQDVHVVTGDNTITINENLFDEIYTDINNNLSYKPINVGVGSFTLKTTAPLNNLNNANLFLLAGNVTTGANTSENGVSKGTPRTQNSVNGYITIAYRNLNGTNPQDYKTELYNTNHIQTYSINLGTMELCKIGDYQDYIYKDNKKWYKKKQINKITLNGTEEWYVGSSATNRSVFANQTTFIDRKDTSSFNDFFCDNFSYRGNAQGQVLGYAMSFNSGQYTRFIYVQVPLDVVAQGQIEDFKTWLSNHNSTIYYILATPTANEITDTTLISQLNALAGAESYSGQTNISQTNDDKPFILTAKALKDLSSL